MAYTGLWVTTDWHFSFILILPLWLYWLNTNINHFNWSAKCHRSDAEYFFFSVFPNYKGLWFWISPCSFIVLESQASKHELSLIGTQCWKHCLFVEFLHRQDPWIIVGTIFLCPRANCWQKKMHASSNTSKPRSTQLVTASGLWSGSREVRLLSYVNFPSPLQFSVLDFYCPDSCWTLGPGQLSDLSFLKMRNGPHVYHHPFNFCLIA